MSGNKDSIAIIGANLYGCLTAAKIAEKTSKKKIIIFDAGSKVLQTFDSIKLHNYYLNNGFHSIEYPRAKKLVDFLKKIIGVKFKFFPNIRAKIIDNFFIYENENFHKYPHKLKQFYKKNKLSSNNYNDFLKNISIELKKIIFKVAERYNARFDDVAHFFIPWFFPVEYKFLSNDEGDVFRNKVRNGKIKPLFAIPKNGRVESLRNNFEKYFKKKNISISLNSKISLQKNKFIISKDNKDIVLQSKKVFLCVPPFFLIDSKLKKDITKNYKFLANVLIKLPSKYRTKKFTEIIYCSSKFQNLGRITNTNYFVSNKNQLLQAELILPNPESLKKEYIKKKFYNELKKTFENLKLREISILDLKITRQVFYPNKKFILKFKKTVIKKIKKIKNKTFYNFFLGPINMSKQWKFSEKFLNSAK